MGNFNRPEGQTTSDNFLKSEIEKDFCVHNPDGGNCPRKSWHISAKRV